MDLERKTLTLELKAEGDAGEIVGYGSVFGNEDSYGDRIEPGAFVQTLARRMPKMLWQHDWEQPIGRWIEAREDEVGLHLKGKLSLGTDRGREARELIADGVLDGLSIGFRTVTAGWDGNVRLLKAVDLWEVSVVTFPANDAATVTAVKSAFTQRDLESRLRGLGLSRTAAKALLARGYQGYSDVLRDAGVEDPDDQRDADAIKASLTKLLSNLRGGQDG
jgi:hypothetical protein